MRGRWERCRSRRWEEGHGTGHELLLEHRVLSEFEYEASIKVNSFGREAQKRHLIGVRI